MGCYQAHNHLQGRGDCSDDEDSYDSYDSDEYGENSGVDSDDPDFV